MLKTLIQHTIKLNMESSTPQLSDRPLKIKVCGMRDSQNAIDVIALKPDYLGFICYNRSARFVGNQEQINKLAKDLALYPNRGRTAVFVDESLPTMHEMASILGCEHIQLHGNESPEYCEALRNMGYTLIKAFGISADFDWKALDAYQTCVDFFLFDTKSPQHGGSGLTFDWTDLEQYPLAKPYFLSGGLSLEHLDAIKSLASKDNRLYGIDLNSKFESSPGHKNIPLLKQLFTNIR
jgi:phosphoribosylanthranilate isomerase